MSEKRMRKTDRVIAILMSDGPHTAVQLGNKLDEDYPIVHALLTDLERQGCVKREVCAHCGSKLRYTFVKVQRPACRPSV